MASLGCAPRRCGSSAKGHADKEAEPIICVSSQGSTQQMSIIRLQCDVGAFHRSYKRFEIIEMPPDSIAMVGDIKILQGV